ncbi:gamma-enolase isoform X2 [Sigmodon hispidus]
MSRGNPTVEIDLCTAKVLFRAAMPSGASTGIYEALQLHDNDKTSYMGKGVSKAVEHINKTMAPALISKKVNVMEQEKIDKLMTEMDSTENKSKFVANVILRVSVAMCKASAEEKGIPLYRHITDLAGNSDIILPVAAFNVINGSSHAGNKLAMQKFMILPVRVSSFREAMHIGGEVSHNLKNVIKEKYLKDATNDPFDQNDWEAWQKFTASAGIQVVGEDLTVTDPKRIFKAMNEKSCNCLLLKVNQIVSVTKSLQACKLAQSDGWGVMVSHRSGETENTFIADLVVGLCTGQIMTGAPCRSEHQAKYNQILRMEEEMSSKAKFAGRSFRIPLAK